MGRKTVVLLYGMLEAYDNPFGVHCLKVYCDHDSILSSELEFEIITFSPGEPAADVARRVLGLRPWVLGISCYVWNTDKTLEICALVKAGSPSTLTIAGGPEAGHVPKEICCECASIDVVVVGEGEETFRQFLLAHLFRRPFSTVQGIVFRDKANLVSTPRQRLVDLATLPVLFGQEQRRYLAGLNQKVMYETLRGCPHVCFFCDWGVLAPGRVRYFPMGRIERELSFILSQDHFSHLYLADSEINIDTNHCKQLLRMLNRLKRDFRWGGAITFHLEISKEIDPEMADLLCEATDGIGIGVQSLGETALYQMGRKWFDIEKFEQNVERLEKDLHFVFQFIYGCPGDTYQTFYDSLKWAVERDRDVWFDRLQVLPGTIYRNKHDRFEIDFERRRPFYARSSSTFSSTDIERAESLKRGFLLYNFRDFLHFESLLEFVGLEPMQLLEAFGDWCSVNYPDKSLIYARTDPRALPEGFLMELVGWVGAFIQTRRSVSQHEYTQLKDSLSATRHLSGRLRLMQSLRSPRGN